MASSEDTNTWRSSALAGDVNAMVQLAELADAKNDDNEARFWFRLAAEAGDADAMWNLGLLFEGVDNEAAEDWYLKAADAGVTTGLVSLGILAVDRGDLSLAQEWFRKGADRQDVEAARRLGDLFLELPDTQSALTWYSRGIEIAEATDSDRVEGIGCLISMAKIYISRGLVEDAEHCLSRAAATGDSEAMILLGDLKYDSDGFEVANNWYSKALDLDDWRAMIKLGDLAAAKNDRTAAEAWYERGVTESGDSEEELNGYGRPIKYPPLTITRQQVEEAYRRIKNEHHLNSLHGLSSPSTYIRDLTDEQLRVITSVIGFDFLRTPREEWGWIEHIQIETVLDLSANVLHL